MERKKGVLNHREISSQGGKARAKKLPHSKRVEIARDAGRISASKRQAANAIKQLNKLAEFFKHRSLSDGTNISALLLAISKDLEEQKNSTLQ